MSFLQQNLGTFLLGVYIYKVDIIMISIIYVRNLGASVRY